MFNLEMSIYVDLLFQSFYLIQNYSLSFPSSISLVASTSLHFINNMNVQDLLTSTIALFVVMDPIGVIPLYVSLTRNISKHERKVISSNAVITTGIFVASIHNSWDYDLEYIWNNHFQLHDSWRHPFIYSCN